MSISIALASPGAISNLDELLETINQWLDRNDLGPYIPGFIRLVEARVNTDFRLPDMETLVDLAFEGETAGLPTDFLAMRSIHIEGEDKPLSAMSPAAVAFHYDGSPGTPVAYVQRGRSVIQLVPPPSDTLTCRINYYQPVPPLTDVVPNNWLLEKFPGVYLFGCLTYATMFLADKEGEDRFRPLYQYNLDQLQDNSIRDRFGGGPLNANTVRQTGRGRC